MLDFEKLKIAMGELEEEEVISILQDVMSSDESEAKKALGACQDGMNIVGDCFEKGEYFVGDLIFAGELMTQAVGILRSALVKDTGSSSSREKMILCTVEGDLHDIGKNIVKAMLEAANFEVLDLGVDVKPEDIIASAKENNIGIIALSGVLTLAIDSMKKTVDAFADAGLRDHVKIIIGGAPVTKESQSSTGADAWAKNPQRTVNICRTWMAASGGN